MSKIIAFQIILAHSPCHPQLKVSFTNWLSQTLILRPKDVELDHIGCL